MASKRLLFSTTMIAGLVALSVTPALAQDATATAPTAPADQSVNEGENNPDQEGEGTRDTLPEPETNAEGESTEVESVVVTGSRLRRSEFNSVSPIQVLTTDQAELRGVSDTGQLLQSSSIAAGSPQVNATISTAFVTNGGPGASTVSLRGLGPERSLVLLNNRRAGPAGTRGSVSAFDLNVIPQSVIERVEILKDGASSIYGSDAVAGVVNIITKKNTDGIDLEFFGSKPFDSGGEQFEVSAGYAKSFDRGYFSVAADYYKQSEQKVGDRDYTNCTEQYIFDPITNRRLDSIDPRTGKFACLSVGFNQIFVYGFNGRPIANGRRLQFDYSGLIQQLVPQALPGAPGNPPVTGPNALGVPPGFVFVGGPAPTNLRSDPTLGVLDAQSQGELDSSLIPETTRATVFAQGGFELTPAIEAYGELLLNRRRTRTNGFRQFWTYTYGEDSGDPFSAGFTGPYFYSPTPGTDHFDSDTTVDYARVVAGIRGDIAGFPIGQGWNYDLFVQHSRSEGEYTQQVILDDAVDSADGRSDFGTLGLFNANSIPRPTASCVGYTTPISNRPCVDVAWMSPRFLAGELTEAERAFLFDEETGSTVYEQTFAEGFLSGDLFTLPAGALGVGVGFQVRKDSINDTPGEVTLADNSWGLTGAGITKGEDTTREVFGEIEVPIFKGQFLAEDLRVTLSGRYTDVESFGNATTYKVGVNWRITPQVRLRATKGTSFRAPGLFELFLADQTSFLGQRSVDPCINYGNSSNERLQQNCAADGLDPDFAGGVSSAQIVSGGGFGVVEAETSDAESFGIVLTPTFADLSVALEYFEIRIEDQITQLGAGTIVFLCYTSETFPTDPVCGQFDRDPQTQGITEVRNSYINIASQVNRGLDLTVRYSRELPAALRFTVDGQATWQFQDTIELFAGNEIDQNGTVGQPDFTGLVNARLDRGPWTLNWNVEMYGKASDAGSEQIGTDRNAANTRRHKVSSEFTAYHSLSLRHRQDETTFLVGLANVFDEHPPAATTIAVGQGYSTAGRSILSTQYDLIGRRLFFNVSKSF